MRIMALRVARSANMSHECGEKKAMWLCSIFSDRKPVGLQKALAFKTGHSLTTFTAKRDILNGLKLHLTHPSRWVTRRRAGVAQVLSHPGQLDWITTV